MATLEKKKKKTGDWGHPPGCQEPEKLFVQGDLSLPYHILLPGALPGPGQGPPLRK